jgi:hypothetical protein
MKRSTVTLAEIVFLRAMPRKELLESFDVTDSLAPL